MLADNLGDAPEPIVEACALLDDLYGFDQAPNRYLQADRFKDDSMRVVVLYFHLGLEELLKALTYVQLRVLDHKDIFSEDQDIAYLQQMRTTSTTSRGDWASSAQRRTSS